MDRIISRQCVTHLIFHDKTSGPKNSSKMGVRSQLKPLILRGGRQVGKSLLVKELGVYDTGVV